MKENYSLSKTVGNGYFNKNVLLLLIKESNNRMVLVEQRATVLFFTKPTFITIDSDISFCCYQRNSEPGLGL